MHLLAGLLTSNYGIRIRKLQEVCVVSFTGDVVYDLS
jgi:hypothetical protein